MLSAKEKLELESLPIRERVASLNSNRSNFSTLERMGYAPTGPRQNYKAIASDSRTEVLMFGSNNYLDLNSESYVKEKVKEAIETLGIGSGGSPGFSGYTSQHNDLELRLATKSNHESALLTPSGYVANLCWVTGLVGKDDLLLVDKNSHASVFDACRMVSGRSSIFDPDNLDELEEHIIRELNNGMDSSRVMITFEGVRSADGSIADVPALMKLSQKYDIFTILDDAHAFGVLGKYGGGTVEHFGLKSYPDVRMATCSKAIGAQGAFLSGSKKTIDFIRRTATPYLFTTALSQPSIAAINAAIDLIDQDTTIIQSLQKNIGLLTQQFENQGLKTNRSASGIIPLYLDTNDTTDICAKLHNAGLFVNLMEYPIIPRSMQRYLRFSVMRTHSNLEIERVSPILKAVGAIT
ncbi:MAG: pyridoxal phosphate-dependent aminotransferase family protein [Rhodobacteraceae bacterium]|nr:pyridoxal phosphate-dependent aminotransferase family protein [Paracoccaceae bacterium]